MLATVGLRDKVDGFRSAACEDDFARIGGVHKMLNSAAGAFIVFCCALGEKMHAAMNVGVVALVIIANRVDDDLRLLRSGGVIKIDERLAADLLMQDRKILAHEFDVEPHCAFAPHRARAGLLLRDGTHPTSSQRRPASAPRAPSPDSRGLETSNRQSLISFSVKARAGSSFMRSRHSLANASSRSLRADDSSMP